MQQSCGMRAWRVHEFGEPEDVLRLDEVPAPLAGPDELLVRVAAATLNFNDVDGVRGRYRTVRPPLPYTPGMEVLGLVEGAGIGAEEWLGKRVVAVPSGAFGGYAELAVGPSAMAFEMPPESDLPDTPAAAVYFPFHLSWLALHDRANIAGRRDRVDPRRRRRCRLGSRPAGRAGRRPGHRDGGLGREGRAVPVAGRRRCDQLPRRRLRRRGAQRNGGPRGRRGVRLGRGRGDDQHLPVYGIQRPSPLGRDSRRASRQKTRGSCHDRCCSGTSPSPGCASPTSRTRQLLKRVSGYNFPSHADGQRVHAHILDLVSAGRVRPVVGREVAFEDLPSALQSMADRQTVGRTVAHFAPWSDGGLADRALG